MHAALTEVRDRSGGDIAMIGLPHTEVGAVSARREIAINYWRGASRAVQPTSEFQGRVMVLRSAATRVATRHPSPRGSLLNVSGVNCQVGR